MDGNRENFYRISGSGEERQFLTARGWEDLSVMIREYEREELPVTPELVEQYLQCPEVAADYYGWYQLYGRFGEKLRLKELWEGGLWLEKAGTGQGYFRDAGLTREEQEAQKEAIRQSGWEERLCVSRYFAGKLAGMLEDSEAEEALCRDTEEMWRRFLGQPADKDTVSGRLRGWLKQENQALAVKSQQGLVDEVQERKERRALHALQALSLELSGYRKSKEPWDRASAWFEKRRETHRERDGERRERLSGFLHYLADALGTETEFIRILSALAVNRDCVRFLVRCPCKAFAGYSPLLQLEDRRRQLQRRLRCGCEGDEPQTN